MAESSSSVELPGIRAFGPISAGAKSAAFIALIGLAQILFYVAALDNSPILPGNWAPFIPEMTFYIILLGFAGMLLLFRRDLLAPKDATISDFVLRLSAFSGVTWLIMSVFTLAISGSGASSTVLSDTTKIQYFVLYGVFVAVSEEMLFRQTLPVVLNSWVLGSVVIFAGLHLPVYLIDNGDTFGIGLISSLAQAAIMGTVLWFVYAKPRDGGILGMGLGATIGIHMTYDLVLGGAVVALPLSLAGLGLVPV
jgi:Type II CAAX prenyl endopeptidase Rce1-like